MRFFINIIDEYIAGVGTGNAGSEISQTQFEHIIRLLSQKPTAPKGFCCRLRANNLTWELVELPPAPPIEEEATAEDYEAALAELGVK